MQVRSIAMVGVGAVGSYYGCRILEAGHSVRFLLRRDYEEVSRSGFQIESCDGDFEVPSADVFQNSTEMEPVDLVILAWKSTANEKVKEVISPLLHEKTRILTLQNGLGNVELLEQAFGKGRVLGGLCFVCINRLAAGKIRHSAGGMVTVGEPVETGILEQIPTLFGDKVEVKLSDDLELAQWRKLVWNIPFNGLCVAEGGVDTQALLSRVGMEEEVQGLMEEVQAAAAALGHAIPNSFLQGQISATRKMGPYKPSSMLDYVHGFSLEVEAIWGEPLRRGEQAGVSLPRLLALYEKIRKLDSER